ncbi:hypothetical protein K469DRAFT_685510 [Zopfia rhizophila CBS 207.26]|uniref:Uncharacterized protein n=1 Tax=Zopfia rhizophila CBS 207.26 TaxID=1314779 RepID=A0A6A6EAQ5_9PEZI|nr:hypothetical protein K469DRAFT_685510 [Zopfia rhizophila CBS 207.26]
MFRTRAGTLLRARLQLNLFQLRKWAETSKQCSKTCLTDSNIRMRRSYAPWLLGTLPVSTKPGHYFSASPRLRHRDCVTAVGISASRGHGNATGEQIPWFDAVATDPYDTLEVIAPFVLVDREGKAPSVKLSHYSLNEYLCSDNIRQGLAKFFHVDIKEADAWLASICLQYLTFSIFDSPLEDNPTKSSHVKKQTRQYTFLHYAALDWFKHMYSAKRYKWISRAISKASGASIDVATYERELMALHLATEFGRQETFDFLLGAGANPPARSASRTTPFDRVTQDSSLHTLCRPKACGSDVDARTWDGWTPLMEAVEEGRENVVDLLLK